MTTKIDATELQSWMEGARPVAPRAPIEAVAETRAGRHAPGEHLRALRPKWHRRQ